MAAATLTSPGGQSKSGQPVSSSLPHLLHQLTPHQLSTLRHHLLAVQPSSATTTTPSGPAATTPSLPTAALSTRTASLSASSSPDRQTRSHVGNTLVGINLKVTYRYRILVQVFQIWKKKIFNKILNLDLSPFQYAQAIDYIGSCREKECKPKMALQSLASNLRELFCCLQILKRKLLSLLNVSFEWYWYQIRTKNELLSSVADPDDLFPDPWAKYWFALNTVVNFHFFLKLFIQNLFCVIHNFFIFFLSEFVGYIAV